MKSVQFRKLFPVKKQIHKMKTRNPKKFVVNSACTERYSKSSVPAMQRLLNEHDKKFNYMILVYVLSPTKIAKLALSLRKFNLLIIKK